MSIKYLDFDLLIERSGDRYKARVLESPAGEASGDFVVPFTPEDINSFFVQIGQTRSFETQQTRRIREFGQSLFEAVFNGAVRDRLRSSMGEASLHSNGLRIRLRLSGTPELSGLPWEFLYDPGMSSFLALSVKTPVIRYLETPQIAQPFAVQPPLRILAVICGPQDYPRLDTEQEWQNLQESMRGLQSRGLVDLQRLDPPTLSSLQQQLRRDQYHILHFVGHGVFSKNDQDGYLLFENAQRGGQRISGHDLGTILHDHDPLRLAVLNACEGARASDNDQFAGTAQSLIQQGIPAVIAMQFRITDQASIMLAHEFYGALADGYPVDAALTEARKAIKTEGNDLEWGTPVLYMRTPDGRIFDVTQPPASQPTQARSVPSVQAKDPELTSRANQIYLEGQEAYYLGQWKTACRKFEEVLALDPNHREAAGKLEIVRDRIQVQDLYAQLSEAESAGDWDQADSTMKTLETLDPDYPQKKPQLDLQRRQARLTRLYAEAGGLAFAGKWEAVQGIFKEIDSLDPRHPDPQGLRSQAKQAIARSNLTYNLESYYSAAMRAMDAENRQEAIRNLRRVRQLQAGYRETDELLRRLESEAKRVPRAVTKEAAPLASSSPQRLEWNVITLFALFAAASILTTAFSLAMDRTCCIPIATRILYRWLPLGIVGGLVFIFFLSKWLGRLHWTGSLMILGASGLGQWLLGNIIDRNQVRSGVWLPLWAAYGILFGAILAWVLHSRGELPSRKAFIVMILTWGLAYAGSMFIANYLRIALLNATSSYFGWASRIPVLATLGALTGGWLTLAQLKVHRGRAANWKTVLAAALGFGLGFLIDWMILNHSRNPLMIHGPVWGLIGGAALAFPSRNWKQYAVLSAAVGVPMWVSGLPSLHPVLQSLLMGAAIGLFLGLDTRSRGGALLGLILGFSVFAFWLAFIYFMSNTYFISHQWMLGVFLLLGAALTGTILAAGWSYLKSSAASPEPA